MEEIVENESPQVPKISARTLWNLRIFALVTIGIALWFGMISMGMVVKAIAKSAEEGETLNMDGKDGNGALGTISMGIGYFLFSLLMLIGGVGVLFQKLWSRSICRLVVVLVGIISIFVSFIGIAVTLADYDPDAKGEGLRILIGAAALLLFVVWGWISLRGIAYFVQGHRP